MSELKDVSASSRKQMQAIQALCPNLRKVELGLRIYGGIRNADNFSAHQLRDFLLDQLNSSWQNVFNYFLFLYTDLPITKLEICDSLKVNHLKFLSGSPDYRRAVLTALGPRLIKLDVSYSTIDVVAELTPYSQLEELSISFFSAVPQVQVEILPTENFLPRLKKLSVDSCLGNWSRLFECPRPSLTSLYLACPHFGIVDRSPFNWIDIPRLFPNLQELHFDKGAGLSLDILREFVPQLKHLKTLTLSPQIFGTDENPKVAIQMRQQNPNGPILRYCRLNSCAHH